MAGVRDILKDSPPLGEDAEVVTIDFIKPETFKDALKNISKVFWPPAISKVKKYIYPFIDACREAGVNHIAFLSLMGVEDNAAPLPNSTLLLG